MTKHPFFTIISIGGKYSREKIAKNAIEGSENMQSKRGSENKAITIYDIAKEAGVSPATVSRVLTNRAKVSSGKRDRVVKVIEKYNFKPNTFAKGLAETKSKKIGVLMADVRNPYYASMFVACETAARSEGYSVILYNFLGDVELEEELLERLLDERVDAIILLGGHADELVSSMEYVEAVNDVMATTPVVITGKLDGTQCNTVRINAMKSMELVMEHLFSLRHEKIAIVGGRMDVLSTYEKVLKYKQCLKERGLEIDPGLIGNGGEYDFSSGYEQMNGIFQKGGEPTAVIAINDFAAWGVIRSIHEHGLEIPGDITLVSYDDTYMAETAEPKLTSVNYNYEEYGKALISTAIRLIEKDESVPRVQMVEPSLVVRESSAVCRDWKKG